MRKGALDMSSTLGRVAKLFAFFLSGLASWVAACTVYRSSLPHPYLAYTVIESEGPLNHQWQTAHSFWSEVKGHPLSGLEVAAIVLLATYGCCSIGTSFLPLIRRRI